jgi:hypothetical protein
MEVFFCLYGEPAVVVKEFDVPDSLESIRVFGGSATIRPPDPVGSEFHKADTLIRVFLGGVLIVNLILKASLEPQNLAIGSFDASFQPATSRKLRVEFQEAGSGLPVNVELQLCGMWFRAALGGGQ